jgi:hypothetical protein
MQTQTSIKEALKALEGSHERIDCSQPVMVPDMQPGMMWAQGDVGIMRIAKLPQGSAPMGRPENGQVAPGTSDGSRHWVAQVEGIAWFRFDGDPLSDIAVKADVQWTLTHPDHAHCTFGPGLYQFIHEQNEQRRRVLE